LDFPDHYEHHQGFDFQSVLKGGTYMNGLSKSASFSGPGGPVVLVIMDGVGIGRYTEGDFVLSSKTPNLDWLLQNGTATRLKAHGTAVGLPSDDDMGNSEVGHNAIGCGRVFNQGAALVNQAIASGSLFAGQTWKKLIDNVKTNESALHLIGLFSDGNVHSHLDHLKAMLRQAAKEGIRIARIHPLIDGRDVPPTSALEYSEPFEAFLTELNAAESVDYAIASGGGRMNITMDRYNANWDMVKRGWDTHVRGAGRTFASIKQAIETFRAEKPGILDQDLPPFVIQRDGKPIGPVLDGDSVIFFNFRGDRALEITKAFEAEELKEFDRGPKPEVCYAGMMQYDGDLGIPANYLVTPPAIDRTMGEYLAATGVHQLAISETQKYGHVTYFFNGNRAEKFNEALEDYVEIKSDVCPFEDKPRMKADEITDAVTAAIESGKYEFIRVNYPNGDMVGHTGIFPAVTQAVEAVDEALGRLIAAIKKAGGILVVSADHGNADDMYEHDKTGAVKTGRDGKPQAKTAHSLNPVPAVVYDPSGVSKARLSAEQGLGISSLAATCIRLLGYEPPPDYTPSIVEVG